MIAARGGWEAERRREARKERAARVKEGEKTVPAEMLLLFLEGWEKRDAR